MKAVLDLVLDFWFMFGFLCGLGILIMANNCTGMHPGYHPYANARLMEAAALKSKTVCEAEGGKFGVQISSPGFLAGGEQGYKFVCKLPKVGPSANIGS